MWQTWERTERTDGAIRSYEFYVLQSFLLCYKFVRCYGPPHGRGWDIHPCFTTSRHTVLWDPMKGLYYWYFVCPSVGATGTLLRTQEVRLYSSLTEHESGVVVKPVIISNIFFSNACLKFFWLHLLMYRSGGSVFDLKLWLLPKLLLFFFFWTLGIRINEFAI